MLDNEYAAYKVLLSNVHCTHNETTQSQYIIKKLKLH